MHAIREGIARYQARSAPVPESRRDLERELEKVRNTLGRLTRDMADGAAKFASVRAELERWESHRVTIEHQLRGLTVLAAAPRRGTRELERAIRAGLAEWRALFTGTVEEARQLLRQLLPRRLRFTPREEGCYEITGDVALGGLIAAAVGASPQGMVPPG